MYKTYFHPLTVNYTVVAADVTAGVITIPAILGVVQRPVQALATIGQIKTVAGVDKTAGAGFVFDVNTDSLVITEGTAAFVVGDGVTVSLVSVTAPVM